ncbi:MAG: Rho termination factor N-terminal domain-containing protein, partial [Bacteroidetes bacterium]|nr:Rho termination factor N-terminal domain-containing protein [Bacteroidota bacterium]
MYDILELNNKKVAELRDIAKNLKIKRVDSLRKQDLVYKILDEQAITATDKKKSEIKKPGRNEKAEVKKSKRERIPLLKSGKKESDKKTYSTRDDHKQRPVKQDVPESSGEKQEYDKKPGKFQSPAKTEKRIDFNKSDTRDHTAPPQQKEKPKTSKDFKKSDTPVPDLKHQTREKLSGSKDFKKSGP